ncbi:hypothetical protein L6164_026466 [Bauhinia variegata]|uniref:Uncharacterized protein n=1 Tax=Bauhinia variegata TaxID=167791 RepID=A0ACB9LQW2_BAUVA|nr:hypothetical protein L6164_026466 [Bauhinia variegata]
MGQTLNGFSKLDIHFEKKLVETRLSELQTENCKEETIKSMMRNFGLERAKEHGWPNTYVFTKAMGEMLVENTKENLPIVIVRPTIISSTYKEPFPGWIEGVRTLDSFAIAYGKSKLTCFPGDIDAIVDVIPADMVVNTIIMAMVANANQCYDNIYHVGSSIRNPLRYINLSDYAHKYFTEKPWMDKDRKPVKVNGRITYLDMASFQRYMFIHYLLPLKVNKKIQIMMRLADLYKPYLFFRGIFDDMNLEKLQVAARQSGVEMDLFYLDPKMIDWEDYFINVHGPGIVKYLFK